MHTQISKKLYSVCFKNIDSFPKPGDIIGVPYASIEEFVKEIESARDEESKTYYGQIKSKYLNKFLQNTRKKDSYYKNNVEVSYGISTRVALRVERLTAMNEIEKGKIHAEVYLDMYNIPDDVTEEQMTMYIDTTYAQVIELQVCTKEHYLSDKSPDNENTFGFIDNTLSTKTNTVYRIFDKVDVKDLKSEDVDNLVLSLGLKEYSRIIGMSTQPSTADSDYENVIRQRLQRLECYDETMNDEFLRLIQTHNLFSYTKRIFSGVIDALQTLDYDLDQETIDVIWFDMFNILTRTQTNQNAQVSLWHSDMHLTNKHE